MYESDRHLIKVLYRYSGIESICNKARVVEDQQPKRTLPSLPIWLLGIYIALFGLASQKYENRVDIIERKVTSIYARLTPITSAILQLPPVIIKLGDSETTFIQNLSEFEELPRKYENKRISLSDEEYKTLEKRKKLVLAKKEILSKIPSVQNYPCPVVPSLFKPHKTFFSLFVNAVHEESVIELRELIVEARENLVGVNLAEVNLEGARLVEINFDGASFFNANLEGTKLMHANFEQVNLTQANLKKADLYETSLNGANLNGANLDGASLENANLRGVKYLTIEQLSKVRTLYNVKNLKPSLMEQVREKYPNLLKEPDRYGKLF
jgi:hypothetical protein